MADIYEIIRRIERGEGVSKKELAELGIERRMSEREWRDQLRVEGMDVYTYMKLNPPESCVFVVPKEFISAKSTEREDDVIGSYTNYSRLYGRK